MCVCIALFSFSTLFGQDTVTVYYRNGKIASKGYLRDGNEQGVWQYWDSLGRKTQETAYLLGRLNGKNIEFYPNGKPKQEATYKLNQLHGIYTEYNEHGFKTIEGYFKNNMRDSSWKYFYPERNILRTEYMYKGDTILLWNSCYRKGSCSVRNGTGVYSEMWNSTNTIKEKGNYLNGFKTGLWETYFENGALQSKGEYVRGEKVGDWVEYYKNGIMKEHRNTQTGVYEVWFITGKPHIQGFLKNEVKDSVWTYWNEQGSMVTRSRYNNGKLDGLQETWFANGKPSSTIEYKADKKQGKAVWYNKDNAKQAIDMEGYFDNDLQHGTWIYWRADGKGVGNTGDFAKGLKTGHWKWYYDGENLWKEGDYDKDLKTGLWVFYYENGQKEHQGNFVNDKEHGKFEQWFDNGKLQTIGYFDMGLMTGTWEGWYEEKPEQKMYSTEYKAGLFNGVSTMWNLNGLLQSEKNYQNGEFHGTSKTYFMNGKPNIFGEYTNGKMTGTWQYFNESGTCEREISYKNGIPEGKWIIRYKEGPLREEMTYKNGMREGNYKYYSLRGDLLYHAVFKNGQVKKTKIDKRGARS